MKSAIIQHFNGDYRTFYEGYLGELTRAGKQYRARCPFHDDHRPSLDIEHTTGQWHCKVCQTGGDHFKMVAKLKGLDGNFPAVLADISAKFGITGNGSPPKTSTKPTSRLIKRYAYQTPDGYDLFCKNRYEPKGFSLCRPDGNGGYLSGMGGVKPVLYRLPDVIASDEVWIVEGEKDADALADLGITATCNFDGAGKWSETYNEHLKGKNVILIPDQDEPGRAHMQKVAAALQGVAASVKVLELPNPTGKKGFDSSDFISEQADPETAAERLGILMEEAAVYRPEPADHGLKIVNAGDWLVSEPPAPDQILEDMIDSGDKMAVLASSKLRKSFFFQQLGLSLAAGRDCLAWHVCKPRRVLYCQFEIREHHSHRRTRNLARAMGITPADLGGRLMIIPGRGLGIAGADGLERIRQASMDFKPEVIMLDPLYKLAEGAENAAEDFKVLLNAFDHIAEQTGAAIIYVHHDTKGSPGDKDIRDRGAGSNVLGRDYDACVTLTAHATEPDATVVEVLLRNYKPQEPFTIVWECVEGGYCFTTADDVLPSKKTSRTKQAAPAVSSYLPTAEGILIGGNTLEMGRFKVLLKEKTGLSNVRLNDFITWATSGRQPPLQTREERGRGIHRKWISMAEAV